MRNLLIPAVLAAVVLTSCQPKNQYHITGTITGLDSGLIYLQKREAGEWTTIDSVQIVDGGFGFRGTIGMPEMWYLTVKNSRIYVPFFVENEAITVNILADSLEGSEIRGSLSHDVYKDFLEYMKPVDQEMNALHQEYRRAREDGDDAAMARADSMYEVVAARQKEQILTFAKEHNHSVVAPYLILRYGYMFDFPEIESAALGMDTLLAPSTYMEGLTRQVDILRAVQIGQPAPDFTQTDTSGSPLTLSSLRGKVLLVDFWASWCGPCRRENPNIVAAWKKYHKKGFDVLGVSLDSERDDWIAAIYADELTWNHVSDLQNWNNEASKLYGVRSIPSSVLLDQEGVIIARNLRGEELMDKLDKVLGSAK